jgi:hypothetical protein
MHRPIPALILAGLFACGGNTGSPRAPGAPEALVANTGDRAFSVGWSAPRSDGGAAIRDYVVTVTPALPGAGATAGRTALLGDATNGSTYTVSVAARNAAGTGPARTIEVTPRTYSADGETLLTVTGDDSPSGIYDPSVVVSGGRAWLAYSSVDYHVDGQGDRVQDVGLRIARSDDGGATWTYARTVVAPGAASLADPEGTVCGQTVCNGRWAYETSWLVEDPAAPPAERFRLYAHQYFLYPPHATVAGQSATKYHLGAIVVWTAAAPDQLGGTPRTALRWNLTPASFTGGVNVNGLGSALAPCLVVAEGSAAVRGGQMDLVLTCIEPGAEPLPQKIVLLRSADHGQSFSYVRTLLEAGDAAWLGASHFTAPALLAGPDPAPVLVVTPSYGGLYLGCGVIPFEDADAGTLRRNGGAPVFIRFDPTAEDTMGGACAAARLPAFGLLRSQVSVVEAWPPVFRIVRGAGL